MAPRGRKPKPAVVRRKDGNPGKRPIVDEARIGAEITSTNVPEPPAHLPAEAAVVWREIVPEVAEVGLARTIDLPVLESLCVHVAIARKALDMISANGVLDVDGLVAVTEKGVPVVSPWHRIYRDSWRDALSIAEHYGLTPISRTRLGIAAMTAKSLADELREALDGPDVIEAEAEVGVVEAVREIEAPKATPVRKPRARKT
jgi:P27 family predicted phage terminase small subunit